MYKETKAITYSAQRRYDKPPGGVWTLAESHTAKDPSYVRITSGEATPGYRRILREGGLLPMTRFGQVECYYHPNMGWHHHWMENSSGYEKKWLGPRLWGDNFVSSLGSDPASGHYDGGALVQKAAANTSGNWDALTFLAEAHQLRGLFSSTLEKVKNYLLRKPGNQPWSDYLAIRYGWRPLLYDLADVQEAIKTLTDKTKREVSRVRSGTSKNWETQTSAFYNFADYQMTVTSTTTYELSARGTVVFRGSVGPFQFNPVKTWWEITRFSFIIDWLVNIGQAIDALAFVIGHIEHKAGYGHLLKVTTVGYTNVVANPGYTILSQDAYHGRTITTYTGRSPASVSISPLFNPRMDFLKAVDLVAILIQILRKAR